MFSTLSRLLKRVRLRSGLGISVWQLIRSRSVKTHTMTSGTGTGRVTRSDPFDDNEWAEAWAYSVEGQEPPPSAQWDYLTHSWTCTCSFFLAKRRCHHVYRFRHEVVVKTDERYL
jgi:hypothetical protein